MLNRTYKCISVSKAAYRVKSYWGNQRKMIPSLKASSVHSKFSRMSNSSTLALAERSNIWSKPWVPDADNVKQKTSLFSVQGEICLVYATSTCPIMHHVYGEEACMNPLFVHSYLSRYSNCLYLQSIWFNCCYPFKSRLWTRSTFS